MANTQTTLDEVHSELPIIEDSQSLSHRKGFHIIETHQEFLNISEPPQNELETQANEFLAASC